MLREELERRKADTKKEVDRLEQECEIASHVLKKAEANLDVALDLLDELDTALAVLWPGRVE